MPIAPRSWRAISWLASLSPGFLKLPHFWARQGTRKRGFCRGGARLRQDLKCVGGRFAQCESAGLPPPAMRVLGGARERRAKRGQATGLLCSAPQRSQDEMKARRRYK